MRPQTLLATAALCIAASLHAQSFATHPCPETPENHSFIDHFFGGAEQACELRTTTFPLANGRVAVNNDNGSIEIIGEDRSDITLEARVTTHAGSPSEAAAILHEINIMTGPTIEARGPHTSGSRNWSVSYKLHVPHHVAANLHTLNGSLTIADVNGAIQGETSNGSLHINNVAGDVHLTTTNGSIQANLQGPTWQGPGLTASTTNGAVHVSLPSNYSAHLIANTTNGGTSVSLPAADQSGVHRHSIDTNIGSGGLTLHFETTNGGISVQ